VTVIDHLSSSQLNTYLNCGMSYFYSKIEHRKAPPGIAAIAKNKGIAIHKGIEHNLSSVIKNQRMSPLSDVKDAVSTAYDAAIKEDEIIETEDCKVGTEKDRAIILTELHYTDIAPKLKPVAVELAIAAYVNDIHFVGYIDIKEKTGRVIDTKSRSATRNKFKDYEYEKSIAGIFYTYHDLLQQKQNGIEIPIAPPYRLDGLIDARYPYTHQVEITYQESDFEYLRLIVGLVERSYETGCFAPCSPGYWKCSPRWCGYYEDICPFGRRKRVIK